MLPMIFYVNDTEVKDKIDIFYDICAFIRDIELVNLQLPMQSLYQKQFI